MRVKVVYVEITNQCNLNCRTCYNRSGLNRERKEISAARLEGIIERFLPLGLERFLISGGEPTLHTEFDDVLALVDRYPQLSFGIVTNGTNHHEKLIERLNTRDNFTLQISLDGSCEEQNAKTRGAGHFEQAAAFARRIHNPNRKPLLKMVVSQHNYEDIASFYELALSLGCIPEYAFIYRSGNGVDGWESKAVSPRQKLAALNLIDSLNTKHRVEAVLPLCSGRCPYVDGLEKLSLCVKTDGSIQPCQSLYDSRYSLGNVFDFQPERFEARLGETAALARERFAADFDCGRCLLRENCGKGCMAAAVNLCGEPLGDDGDCDFRRLQLIGFNLKKTPLKGMLK
ncbi:MAG: radical SAM protein [Clostridiales bacterium]|jgi:radical SAM protein with 4Fe4S-binding SPASM domain|nr:radical SAM protein [Clostridiales bacterium]